MTAVETVIELLLAHRPGFVLEERWLRWISPRGSRGRVHAARGAGSGAPVGSRQRQGRAGAGPERARAGSRQRQGRSGSDAGTRRETPGGGQAGEGAGRELGSDLASCYAELGVTRGASLRQVRRAWLRLVRRHHPDLCGQDRERQQAGTELLKRVNHAYETIRKHAQEGV